MSEYNMNLQVGEEKLLVRLPIFPPGTKLNFRVGDRRVGLIIENYENNIEMDYGHDSPVTKFELTAICRLEFAALYEDWRKIVQRQKLILMNAGSGKNPHQ